MFFFVHRSSYLAEIDGQRDFYNRIGTNPDLSYNTDGVDRGNLYENKLNNDNITAIKTLETTLKNYYETEIIPLLFKYELIK